MTSRLQDSATFRQEILDASFPLALCGARYVDDGWLRGWSSRRGARRRTGQRYGAEVDPRLGGPPRLTFAGGEAGGDGRQGLPFAEADGDGSLKEEVLDVVGVEGTCAGDLTEGEGRSVEGGVA
jgi:hypothetical protein